MRCGALLLVFLLPSVGCSDAASPTGDVCKSASGEARARVERVVEANRACATDADCFVVPFGAGCFDSCTTSVNLAGKTAVDRAEALVEAGECRAFDDAGCVLEHPPCAPPAAAKCEADRCQ